MKKNRPSFILFTDLDESLLDSDYSFKGAEQTLKELRRLKIPIVICSSKTKEEIEHYRRLLNNKDPFIVENGGAVYIPQDYFPFPLEDAKKDGKYKVIEYGITHEYLKAALKEIAELEDIEVRCYTDLSLEDLHIITGLPINLYFAAQSRMYDEPFLLPGGMRDFTRLRKRASKLRLRIYKGERFFHIVGRNDKGKAVKRLICLYRRMLADNIITGSIGDGPNDMPMLSATDKPILLGNLWQLVKNRPTYKDAVHIFGTGPSAWSQGVNNLIKESSSS